MVGLVSKQNLRGDDNPEKCHRLRYDQSTGTYGKARLQGTVLAGARKAGGNEEVKEGQAWAELQTGRQGLCRQESNLSPVSLL